MGSGAWAKIFVLNPCNGEHGSLLCIQVQAIRQAKKRKVVMMRLTYQVQAKYEDGWECAGPTFLDKVSAESLKSWIIKRFGLECRILTGYIK